MLLEKWRLIFIWRVIMVGELHVQESLEAQAHCQLDHSELLHSFILLQWIREASAYATGATLLHGMICRFKNDSSLPRLAPCPRSGRFVPASASVCKSGTSMMPDQQAPAWKASHGDQRRWAEDSLVRCCS